METFLSGENIYNTIGFLNRLWSYGADIFDLDGNLTIHSPNAVTALRNYIKKAFNIQIRQKHKFLGCRSGRILQRDTAMAVFL